MGLIACLGLGSCAAPTRPPASVPTPAGAEDELSRPFLAPLELTSDPLEDAIVRVVGGLSCSGTVIAPDLVLTAHHCVVQRDARGKPKQADMAARDLRVELGGDDLPWAVVAVEHVVTPDCGYEQGAGDLAILVLERELVGWPVMNVRLHEPPLAGEQVTPWGFGRCAMSNHAIRRHGREGGAVSEIDDGVFEATAGVCPGDSGGPVLDSRRQVVGVVSAAVMDTDPRTPDPAFFARVDAFPSLFSAARELADGRGLQEHPPYRNCR